MLPAPIIPSCRPSKARAPSRSKRFGWSGETSDDTSVGEELHQRPATPGDPIALLSLKTDVDLPA